MREVFDKFLEAHGVDHAAFWKAHQDPDVDPTRFVTAAFPWSRTETTPPYGEIAHSSASLDFWNEITRAWKVEISKGDDYRQRIANEAFVVFLWMRGLHPKTFHQAMLWCDGAEPPAFVMALKLYIDTAENRDPDVLLTANEWLDMTVAWHRKLQEMDY